MSGMAMTGGVSSLLLSKLSVLGFEPLGTILGKGLFAKVVLVKEKSTEKIYAFKEIFHPGKWCKTDEVRGECQAASLPDSSNFFLKIRGFLTANSGNSLKKWHLVEPSKLKECSDDYIVGVLSEYIPGSENLFDFNEKRTLTKKKVCDIGKQIASALKEMHERGLIHRDVKLENILIDKNGKIKLIDYGLSRSLRGGRANTLCGSMGYVAPEIYKRETHGVKADAWAFGVLLYALAFDLYPPFIEMEDVVLTPKNTVEFADSGITIEDLFKQKNKSLINSELGRDDAFWTLLNKLLCHEDKRITVAEALEELFLKEQAHEESTLIEISHSRLHKFLPCACL